MKVEIWRCNAKKRFPTCIGAWFIRRFQGTGYTHYAIRPQGSDGSFYDASVISGVSNRPAKSFFKDYELFGKAWTIDVGTWVDFQKSIEPFMKKKYGLVQAIGIGLKYALKLKKNPFRNGDKQIICNELCLRFVGHNTGKDMGKIDNATLLQTESKLTEILGQPKVAA